MSHLKTEDLKIKVEDKKDFKQSVITRSNLTNEFTIADIEKHLELLNKMKKEVDGTVSLAEKMIGNIETNHKKLIDSLTDEEKSHVWLWQENATIVNENKPHQKKIDEEIVEHEGYIDTVYKAFGFVKTTDNNGKIKRG